MIYFVGIHHKPGLPALCSTTQSGKKIDAVIKRLNHPCEKANLFSTDYIPEYRSDQYKFERQKFFLSVPMENCTIVLLGNDVVRHFPFGCYQLCKVIIFRHPAFSRSTFVDDLVSLLL